jgi:Fur family zinc uptake transcriptional regulator
MAHTHANLAGDPLMAAAEQALAKAGEQWTPMRARVFATMSAFGRPASAYEVAARVSAQEGRQVPANSIYRILDLFVAANLVIRVESANAFVVNAHPACRHDCLFLICDGCGAVTHLDDDTVGRTFRQAAAASGFTPERSVIEMRGRCTACRDAPPA